MISSFEFCYLISDVLFNRHRAQRSRSRSVSRSPGHYHRRYKERSRSRSPIRSPSPVEKRSLVSERLKSRLGPRVDDQPFRSTSGRKSRSRSEGPCDSRSSDPSPPRRRKRTPASPSRSRSSSPAAQRGLVSYEDISPDTR